MDFWNYYKLFFQNGKFEDPQYWGFAVQYAANNSILGVVTKCASWINKAMVGENLHIEKIFLCDGVMFLC